MSECFPHSVEVWHAATLDVHSQHSCLFFTWEHTPSVNDWVKEGVHTLQCESCKNAISNLIEMCYAF